MAIINGGITPLQVVSRPQEPPSGPTLVQVFRTRVQGLGFRRVITKVSEYPRTEYLEFEEY